VSYVAAVLGGYLAGSIPTGYWLVRLVRRIDIRRVGSRSIGATNVWRVLGWWVLTFLVAR
jgi:glycerol-3-phosphate acyltransferase PlsY